MKRQALIGVTIRAFQDDTHKFDWTGFFGKPPTAVQVIAALQTAIDASDETGDSLHESYKVKGGPLLLEVAKRGQLALESCKACLAKPNSADYRGGRSSQCIYLAGLCKIGEIDVFRGPMVYAGVVDFVAASDTAGECVQIGPQPGVVSPQMKGAIANARRAEKVRRFVDDVLAEFGRAASNHHPFVSLHEGYGVLLEEVDEFWDEVKQRQPDYGRARKELVQIAAMAARNAVDCIPDGPKPPAKRCPDAAKDEAFAEFGGSDFIGGGGIQ